MKNKIPLDLLKRMRDEFKKYEIPVSLDLTLGTLPGRIFLGLCYKKAWDYFQEHESEHPVLVHGIRDFGSDNDHAWVELPGDIVFDGVFQRFYRKKDFNKFNKIIKTIKYPWTKKIFIRFLEDGTYGPWESK